MTPSTRRPTGGHAAWTSISVRCSKTSAAIGFRKHRGISISSTSTAISARYYTDEARSALNGLWRAVDDRLNYFTPTRKPAGWTDGGRGEQRRIYDEPSTPFERLRAAGVMSPTQEDELIRYADGLDPARLTEEIIFWQNRLQELAA